MTKNFLLLFVLLPGLLLAQHSIKGTFSPAKNYEWAILYKVTPTTSIYAQKATVDEKGDFIFKLDSTITKGVYRIVYALPQEEFNFDLIYNGKENIELSFHQTDGVNYKKSKENQLLNSYTNSMNLVNQAINNYYLKGEDDEKAFKSIFKTLSDTQVNFVKAGKGLMALNFIEANDPYIPQEVEDVKIYSKNLKDTYLKKVDFNNTVLQNSGFLIERVMGYVFGMNPDPNDEKAIQGSIDVIAEKMANSQIDLKKTLLQIVWQQLSDLDFENSANYLTDNYLLAVAKTSKDEELKDILTVHKNTSLGAKATDFSWKEDVKGKSKTKHLSTLDSAQYYAVVFWSSTCSHCLKELPELKKYIETLPEGKLKVVAIGLEEEPYHWNNESAYYPDFIHVYGEKKWDNVIGNAYGVVETPTYFILDQEKKIISKPDDIEALKAFVDKQNMLKKELPKTEISKEKGAAKKVMSKGDKSH